MSPHDAPAPEGGTKIDPLEATLADIYGSHEAMSAAIDRLDIDIQGVVRGFAEFHGQMQALEAAEAEERKKMHADVRLCLKELRDLTKRLGPLESKVAGIEMALSERSNGAG